MRAGKKEVGLCGALHVRRSEREAVDRLGKLPYHWCASDKAASIPVLQGVQRAWGGEGMIIDIAYPGAFDLSRSPGRKGR